MKWEYYLDHSYYDMYAVRPEGDHDYQSAKLFHTVTKLEAERLCNYLNGDSEYESQVGQLLTNNSWMHLIAGLAAETGEVNGVFQKALYKDVEFSKVELINELGDVLFYLTALCNKADINLEDLKKLNVEKLGERHGR